MRLVCSSLVVFSSLLYLSGCPAEDDVPSDGSSSGTTSGSVGSTSTAGSSSGAGSTTVNDPSNTSGLESSEGGEVGESSDGCDVLDPPDEGFCNCEDCGPPQPVECGPLEVTCTLDPKGVSLSESCIDPVADDVAAVDCLLQFLVDNPPSDATARWQIALDEAVPETVYFSRRALANTPAVAWGFGADSGAWANSGLTGETGFSAEAQACLDLDREEHIGCLHGLIDLLDPGTCDEPVPEECA